MIGRRMPNRTHLINADPKILRTILQGDGALASCLGMEIAAGWSALIKDVIPFVLQQIETDPLIQSWGIYLIIQTEENRLIGNGGFKGLPYDRQAEIGYEIAESYRNQGFATESVRQLIRLATESGQVNRLIAHTWQKNNPSARVLKKCGFNLYGKVADPDDGILYRWSIDL